MYCVINRKKVRRFRKNKFWTKRKSNLDKPRLCVFKSNRHIQAQIIDDKTGFVITSASSLDEGIRNLKATGKEIAQNVGKLAAERALKSGVTKVVFDRNGFNYHGRVQVLADAARNVGLEF